MRQERDQIKQVTLGGGIKFGLRWFEQGWSIHFHYGVKRVSKDFK